MDTKILFNKILQLAIEGKLLSQIEIEGSAKDLIAEIENEKKRQIEEYNKNNPNKKQKKYIAPLPIPEEDKPFDIPSSWKWVRLGDVCENLIVPQRDKPTRFDGNIPWCRIEDIEGKYIYGSKSNQLVSKELIKEMNMHICPKESVIFSCSATIGVPAIVKNDLCTNQTFIGLVEYKQINNLFLYYYLKSQKDNFYNIGTGSTIKYISKDKIANYPFPLPPLGEQQRISTTLEAIKNKLDIYEENQLEISKNADLLKKQLLHQAICGKLVSQNPDEGTADDLIKQIEAEKKRLIEEEYQNAINKAKQEGKSEKEIKKIKKKEYVAPQPISPDDYPFDIPNSWRWVRLRDIFEMQAGKAISASELTSSKNETNKYPCFGGNGIRGYISKKSHSGTHCIIGRQGALCGNVNLATGVFYATEHAVVVYHSSYIDVIWAYYFLKISNLNQYKTATAQPGIAVSTILQTFIPLPPLSEQRRIVEKLEELFVEIDKLK